MNLAKDIAYLLFKHNCVIIPGFGAFLVNEKSAELNVKAKYVSPSKKAITFNGSIKGNDGLLANHLSTKYNCSYEQGLDQVNTYLETFNGILADKRNVEVSEIGTFYLTREEKLVFVPYHSVNFSQSSFGLPKIRLREYLALKEAKDFVSNPIPTVETPKQTITLSIERQKSQKRLELQEKKAVKQIEKKKVRRRENSNLSFVNFIGSLFLIAMIGAVLFFEINNKNSEINNYANLVDTSSPKVGLLEDIKTIEEVEIIQEPTPSSTISKPTITFHDICTTPFNNLDEAEALLQSLNDKYTLAKIEENSLNQYVVSIISFTNQDLAIEYKDLIQNKINQNLVIITK